MCLWLRLCQGPLGRAYSASQISRWISGEAQSESNLHIFPCCVICYVRCVRCVERTPHSQVRVHAHSPVTVTVSTSTCRTVTHNCHTMTSSVTSLPASFLASRYSLCWYNARTWYEYDDECIRRRGQNTRHDVVYARAHSARDHTRSRRSCWLAATR